MLFHGWDIGGAHLKHAVVDGDGRVQRVTQYACALWQGLPVLEACLQEALEALPMPAMHAVTMTGELCDLFPDRRAGVQAILDVVQRRLGDATLIHARSGLVTLVAARQDPLAVASMNWLATLRASAACRAEGLLLDIGSTTTDVLAWRGSQPAVSAWQDGARLASGELVYTGACRTPVMAIARRVGFAGGERGMAAELFATMADVYRILGELPAGADDFPTADGRPADRAHSLARLARMVGEDVDSVADASLVALAHDLAVAQRAEILTATRRRIIDALGGRAPGIVGTGAGAFIAARVAAELDVEYTDFASLMNIPAAMHFEANVCAPAVALAVLAVQGAKR